jgi:L-asparaginase
VVTCGATGVRDAVVLAASGATTGFGTVAVLDGEISTAREVTRPARGCHGGYGVVGTVGDGRVRVHRAPARAASWTCPGWATPFDVASVPAPALPRVEIVHGYVDAAMATVAGLVAAGAGGIVVAGEPSGAQLSAVHDGSACGVLFAGPGLLDTEDLHPHKARLLLLLSLGLARDRVQAARWFTEHASPTFGDRPAERISPFELPA